MKRVLLSLVAVLACAGCTDPAPPRVVKTLPSTLGHTSGLQVVEIDECEYLYGDWANATVLTHKGNCKFCAERANKTIWSK